MTPSGPKEELPIFEVAKIGATELLSKNLVETFDGIAKLAMRASAEFADTSNDQNVLQKVQKAHSAITLIIDDAMRGLGEATQTLMAYATVSVLASEEEENSK
jgi:hypothetical protein